MKGVYFLFFAMFAMWLSTATAQAEPELFPEGSVQCTIGNTNFDLGTFPSINDTPQRFSLNLIPTCESTAYPNGGNQAEAAYCLLIEQQPYGRYLLHGTEDGRIPDPSKMQVILYSSKNGSKPIGSYGGETSGLPMVEVGTQAGKRGSQVKITMPGRIWGELVPVKKGDLYPANGEYAANFIANYTAGASKKSGDYDRTSCNAWGIAGLGKSQTLYIKARFKEACNVRTDGDVHFGVQFDLDAPHYATGTIAVNCSQGQKFAVSLDDGLYWLEHGKRRMMRDGGNQNDDDDVIRYDLFRNSAHSQPWTNDAPTEQDKYIGTGDFQTLTVYAATEANQGKKNKGTYRDTVIVTVRSFAQ